MERRVDIDGGDQSETRSTRSSSAGQDSNGAEPHHGRSSTSSPSPMSPDTLRRSLRHAHSQRNLAMRKLRAATKASATSIGGAAHTTGGQASQQLIHRKSAGRANITAKGKRQRQRVAAKMFLRLLELRPAEDVPYVLSRILLAMSIQVRAQLRGFSFNAQEYFLAKRESKKLPKTDVFTAKKTLEMRLENFWPTRALERAMQHGLLQGAVCRRPLEAARSHPCT
eukprot:17448-Pleurochrysis_carterae.AAC.3